MLNPRSENLLKNRPKKNNCRFSDNFHEGAIGNASRPGGLFRGRPLLQLFKPVQHNINLCRHDVGASDEKILDRQLIGGAVPTLELAKGQ